MSCAETICAGPHHTGTCFLKYFLMLGAAWSTKTLTASMSLKFGDSHCPAERADLVIARQSSWHGYCKFMLYQTISPSFAQYWQRASPYPCWVFFSSLQTLWQTWNPFLCAKKGTTHPLCSTRDTSLSPHRSPKPICILESIEKHSPAENNLCRVKSHKNHFMGVHGLQWDAFESWKKRFQ